MKIHEQKDRLAVTKSDISGSLFDDVNLSGATYENVNMSGGKYHNINLSGCSFDDLNMSGWTVHNVNLSGLSDFNDLSKPDGCWFSKATGILWIETDDNTYTDVTNCMLLAAIPGTMGDGGPVTVVNKADGSPNRTVTADVSVTTRMGAKLGDAKFKRFLTAPKGAEVTGVAESPDGKTLFVNIQHPGENTAVANIADPTKYESRWPGNGGGVPAYGPGGANARPRSATIVITKNDGGVIGL